MTRPFCGDSRLLTLPLTYAPAFALCVPTARIWNLAHYGCRMNEALWKADTRNVPQSALGLFASSVDLHATKG